MYHRDRTNVGATPPASDTATRAVITFSSPGKSVMKLSLQNTGLISSPRASCKVRWLKCDNRADSFFKQIEKTYSPSSLLALTPFFNPGFAIEVNQKKSMGCEENQYKF